MKTIDWKDKYVSFDGIDISATANYVSTSGRLAGLGTRNDPFYSKKILTTNTLTPMIFGDGVFDISIAASASDNVGNSRENSIINTLTGGGGTQKFSNMTLRGMSNLNYCYFKNCILDDVKNLRGQVMIYAPTTSNCIFKGSTLLNFGNAIAQVTFLNCINSGIGINDLLMRAQSLLVKSQITITQAILTSRYTLYQAFNNCNFAIGAESSATPLIGNNANELRADFVSRCTAQGLTVPSVTEFGSTTPAGRWVFSNTSIAGDYDTIKGSEIDLFAKLRGIYFGHTNQNIKQVPITTTLNVPASFNAQTPVKDALVTQDSIGLLASSDFTKRVEAYADSKIIWLGGLAKLTLLSLVQNLPSDAGVAPDSVYGLAKTATASGSIVAASHYIIRSNNDQVATIKYNNVVYTSSLITRNNVFLGVTDVTTFENTSGNAQIYQVLDFANHNSLQIRLMRELPAGNITTGNLQAGYWYFVEPNNLNDTSGTITYKGIIRPAFDSFVAEASNLTFTVNGTCHLRRCWKQDFDYTTEITDKSFWTDRQKPNYFDVISDDLRCLLKNNSSASAELAKGEDGVYIGSGHPEFYNAVNGVNGLKAPAYNITGTYLQIRVPITTANLM